MPQWTLVDPNSRILILNFSGFSSYALIKPYRLYSIFGSLNKQVNKHFLFLATHNTKNVLIQRTAFGKKKKKGFLISSSLYYRQFNYPSYFSRLLWCLLSQKQLHQPIFLPILKLFQLKSLVKILTFQGSTAFSGTPIQYFLF